MKKLITNYTFNAAAKTITFSDYSTISLESVLLVTNVTDGIVIYNFADPNKGGTVATNVLTLEYNTASMDNTDDIQIYYDDTNASQAVQLNAEQSNTTGSITTASSAVTMTSLAGIGAVTVSIYGTYAGVNASFEVYDGVNWVPVFAQPTNTVTPTLVSSTGVLTTNSTNTWNIGPLLGWSQFRVRATAWTSGTASVIIAPSAQFTQYLVNVGAMPAITGTVTANLGTGGTGATSLGKAEDAVHASGDVGVMSLAVRQDAEATLVSATGDYSPLSVDATGKLRTSVAGTVAHDAVDAGNPIKIGGKASSSAPADVAAGDRVDAYFDLKGRQKVDGSDVVQPVSATSLPLPTGASTSANQATGNASLATIAGAVAGTEMQVDVLTLPALPAGNNNIGDVDIASSVLPTGAATSALQTSGNATLTAIDTKLDGTLDVAIVSGGGSGVQYTDADSDATPTGTLAMWFNNTNDTVHAASENNPLPVYDNAVEVAVANVQTDTGVIAGNSGTMASDLNEIALAVNSNKMDVNIASGGATQYAEASTTSPAVGTAALGRYLASPPGTLTDGQMSMPLMDNYGQLKVVPVGTQTIKGNIDSGSSDGDNAVVKVGTKYNVTQPTFTDGQRGELQINSRGELKVSVTQAGQSAGMTASFADGSTNTVGAMNVGAYLKGYNGTTWDRLYSDTTNGLDVDVTRVIPGTGATHLGKAEDAAHATGDVGVMALAVRKDSEGALAGTDGDYIPLTTDGAGKLRTSVAGTVNHDATDAGAPVKIGQRATASVAGETLVAAGDRTDILAGLDGVPIVRPHSSLEDLTSGTASNTDGTSTQVVAAAGAGIKTYLTSITIANTSASNITVELKDGSTTKWVFPVPANGGVTHTWETPIAGTANTAWNFDPSAATTTVFCSAAGFKSKV